MASTQPSSSPPASVRIDEEKLEDGPSPARDAALSDGTFYQLQVSGKPVRKHFFSPPDGTLAEAVNRDADNVQFTDVEEVRIQWLSAVQRARVLTSPQKAVRRKIDLRVLSLVVASYICAFSYYRHVYISS